MLVVNKNKTSDENHKSKRTKGERHEQKGTDRRHKTDKGPRFRFGNERDSLENVRTLRGATVPFGHEIDEKQESMK